MNTEFLLRKIEELRLGIEVIDLEGVGVLVSQILGILAFLSVEARDAIEELNPGSKSEWPADLWPLSVSRQFFDDRDFKAAVAKYLELYREDDRVIYDIALQVFYKETLQGVPMHEAVDRTIENVRSKLRLESIRKLERRLNRLVTEAS